MRKYLMIMCMLISGIIRANCQEVEFGKNLGVVYVTINGQNPKTYIETNDTMSVSSPYISDVNIGLDIQNNTNELLWVDYSNSYFIVAGKTSDLIPGQTYLKDVNLEIKKSKIAPKTKITVDAYSRDNNSFLSPIFSYKRAKQSFKEKGEGAVEKLVISFLTDSGHKFEKHFVFNVMNREAVENLKKQQKKKEKELKRQK